MVDLDNSAYVSVEAIQKALEAFRGFRARSSTLIEKVAYDVTHRLDHLQRVREDLAREVNNYREQLADCDDDDRARIQDLADEAEESLRHLDTKLSQVAPSLASFKRANQLVGSTIDERLPKAIARLDEKLADATAIESEPLAVARETSEVSMVQDLQRSTISIAPPAASNSASNGSLDPATRFFRVSLPNDVVWIQLADISRADDLRPDERFHKVSEPDVRKGFSILETEILPALERDPTVSAAYFAEVDRVKNRVYSVGAQRVFEAFFGTESIVVTPGRNVGKLGVTNGRHRIHVARQLGWSAVPARLIK